MSIEYDRVISIVSNCTDLMNYMKTYQDLFLEYAVDDYLLLDEHLHSIYEKVLRILHDLHQLTSINSDIYKFEKDLLCYLPSTYIHRISSSFSKAITTTLIEQTARLFTSASNALFLNDDDDDNDCIIISSFLFSTCPLSINADKDELTHQENNDQSRSLLQLDKINLRTAMLTQSQLTPAFQFDLTDLDQIEDDLSKNSIEEKTKKVERRMILEEKIHWIEIEREFVSNIISLWSTKDRNIQTINPWSSETLWKLITNFKYSDVNLQCEFILIIQWAFCLLTIQALDRDWDLCNYLRFRRLYFNDLSSSFQQNFSEYNH